MLERRDSYDVPLPRFPLENPRTLQHRRRGLRPLGGRGPGPDRASRLPHRRRARTAELWRACARARTRSPTRCARCGIRRGDRVALLLPQCFETAIAHVAIYKLGAIAVPLALLFGVEALEYRLQTAGVKAVVTNAAGHAKTLADQRPAARSRADRRRSTAASGGADDFHRLAGRPFARISPPRTPARTIRR